MNAVTEITVSFPKETYAFDVSGDKNTSSLKIAGAGTLVLGGLPYSLPAHSQTTLTSAIEVVSLTSADLQSLNDLVMGLLSPSAQTKVRTHEIATFAGDLSFWDMLLSGRGAASGAETQEIMARLGLTEAQITQIIDALFDRASSLSGVHLHYEIDNSQNGFAVSGALELFTLAGEVTTAQGTRHFRMLANVAQAGQPKTGQAPAKGQVLSLI